MNRRNQLFERAVTSADLRLVSAVAVDDPKWTTAFLGWLRTVPGMREPALAAALEAARAMLAAGIPGSRQVVLAVLRRADDPGAALEHWTGRGGRAVPKPVKRAIADAVARLYTERAFLDDDAAESGFRFADVIDLVHPTPVAPWQAELFQLALSRRRGREMPAPASLPLLAAHDRLRAEATCDPSVLLDPARLRAAGMSGHTALSLAGSKVDRALLWRALVPVMSYTTLLSSLRQLDEAQVPDDVVAAVAARLADPVEVIRSRTLPLRFLAAHAQAPTLHWFAALNRALQASLVNIPPLPGRTLVLVDFSREATLRMGAVYAVSLASKGQEIDLHGYGSRVFRHEVPRGASVLGEVNRFLARAGEAGRGSRVDVALARTRHERHDRVIVVSSAPRMLTGAGTHWLTEITEHTFRLIPLLEAARRERWPWRRRTPGHRYAGGTMQPA